MSVNAIVRVANLFEFSNKGHSTINHKLKVRSNKLINHNQIFFSHLSVISQFIASDF